MLLCVQKGLEMGYKRFVIAGGLGGERMDHSIANLQLLHYIALNKGTGFLLGKNTVFTCVHNSRVSFWEKCEGYISVFSLSDESRGVTIENLKYETRDITFKNHIAMGLSNEFIGKKSYVQVKDGALLIGWNGKVSDCITE
jgi:thiamine pyrophosphokinase